MRRLLSLATLIGAVMLLTTGCMTESLHDANLVYANPAREITRSDQKLIGSYVGTDYCNGTLSEIYQFESPFIQHGKPKLLEVQIPVYGITAEQPVRAFETPRARPFEDRAELWFWRSQPTLAAENVQEQASCRRIDIFWTDSTDQVEIRRYISGSGTLRAPPCFTDLRVPWKQRSRIVYAARHLGYALTVPADATLYTATYTGIAIGYSFLVCPTGTIWLLSELL